MILPQSSFLPNVIFISVIEAQHSTQLGTSLYPQVRVDQGHGAPCPLWGGGASAAGGFCYRTPGFNQDNSTNSVKRICMQQLSVSSVVRYFYDTLSYAS